MRCPYEVIISCDKCSDNYSAAVYELNNTPNSGTRLNTYKNASPLGPDSLQLLSDSYLIASSATKPCVYLWPLNSESPTSNLKLNTPGKVSALTCTPDGSYIAVAIGETINIWQSCSGALVRSLTRHFQTINCLTFNGDGSCLASAGEDCIIFIWQLSQVANKEEAEPYTLFDHHTLPIKALHFGQVAGFGRLYSAALDRTARVYNVYSKELLLTVRFDFPLTTISTDIKWRTCYSSAHPQVL